MAAPVVRCKSKQLHLETWELGPKAHQMMPSHAEIAPATAEPRFFLLTRWHRFPNSHLNTRNPTEIAWTRPRHFQPCWKTFLTYPAPGNSRLNSSNFPIFHVFVSMQMAGCACQWWCKLSRRSLGFSGQRWMRSSTESPRRPGRLKLLNFSEPAICCCDLHFGSVFHLCFGFWDVFVGFLDVDLRSISNGLKFDPKSPGVALDVALVLQVGGHGGGQKT